VICANNGYLAMSISEDDLLFIVHLMLLMITMLKKISLSQLQSEQIPAALVVVKFVILLQ